MREDLYQPSLGEDYVPLRSFKLTYIYTIAFFGGVIPLIGICGKNARWLKVRKSRIYGLACLCVLVLLIKLGLLAASTSEVAAITYEVIDIFYRASCVGLAFLYRFVMKVPYACYQCATLPFKPMKAYVVLYLVIAFAAEMTLLFLVFVLFIPVSD